MVAYKLLGSDEMKENNKPAELSRKMIKKMKIIVKSHRCALDFDRGFLNKVIDAEGYDFVAEVKSEKLGSVKAVTKKREGVQKKRLFQTFLAYKVEMKKQKGYSTHGFIFVLHHVSS